ncbi:MAG: T9SS type A sorting domain-containing protein [bacterium]|nr:MAG: T9SS type A sorting domain-containing protein [bacterium]
MKTNGKAGHPATVFVVMFLFTCVVLYLIPGGTLRARNPIRRTFFNIYPNAENTQLDNLPSSSGHCGVCHFDFNGGGPRNPYGLAVEVGLNNGLSNSDAILAIDGNDSDADGFINSVEASDIVNFTNTPTFPGLTESNKNSVVNIPVAEVEPYLTPSGSTDTIPPTVTVNSPNGGENVQADDYLAISYTADDASGISSVDIFLSDDSGVTWKPVAANESPGTGFSWFVPNYPGSASRIRVVAYDNAGNPGVDDSDGDFTIIARPPGYVPSTLRDLDLSGTQPHEGAILDDPDQSCGSCHGNYDTAVEPWFNWRGSMMGQSARDPFFFACMAIAEQEAPSAGDVCIRCHSPGGWQEGRSIDTDGDLLNVKDRHGVQCDFCHRIVDHNYIPGVSPAEDEAVLATVSPLPLEYANGQFINDPAPIRRGPYADAEAAHAFVESPIHRSADLCGICHDVSNPVFDYVAPGDYTPNAFDTEHPDMDLRNMFPIERTYSEWSQSEYASTGVYAPQFAGDKPDGIVSTCQDCHMRDVTGKGSNESGAKTRTDLGLHDFTGGNTFILDVVPSLYPDEVDVAQLQAAEDRARSMLQLAATMEIIPEEFGITVRVTNETGHKLSSGYPEGRRIWLNVKAYDSTGVQIFESGAYDFDTADLIEDSQIKVYEIHPGLSPGLAGALGLTPGKSFHFVLNDTIYSDNRIPPRGFTNAGFEAVQSPPVAYAYADGQYWDDTPYALPAASDSVTVTLYYQSTSKEYVVFLRDENTTNSAGQDLYDAWVAQGKSPPEIMVHASAGVNVTVTGVEEETPFVYGLVQNFPNPFNPITTIRYSLAGREHVLITVYDVRGARVRTLVDRIQDPGRYHVVWDSADDHGEKLSSGVYFVRYRAGAHRFVKKAVLLR